VIKMDKSIRLQFEQIFIKHYEQLTGTKQSVGGLDFTLENIICFILLGGRELAIEDVYGDVSERYSLEQFLVDAAEAGVEADEHLQETLKELTVKKFIHEQPDGKFYSYQATRDTARMFNRIYPKMQGLNLLAYIGQTVQEAQSGRTDISSAVSRFDQTLAMQGVPLPKPKIPVITLQPPPASAVKKEEEPQPTNRRIFRDYVVTDTSPKPKTEPLRPAAEVPRMPEGAERRQEDAVRVTAEIAPQSAPVDKEPPLSEASKVSTTEKKPVAVEPASALDQSARSAQEIEQPQSPEKEDTVDDDEIAARVAAFEKDLALVCPICKTNVLTEKQTAAGKVFYSCTAGNCNFISWGRPHHIACPRCKNPFLVEVTDSAGQLILKCPRATCQYRQALTPAAGAGVKVVRKRLVRRKV
jgi:hypothetical protein